MNMDIRERTCWENTKSILITFQNLGFTVHPEPNPESSFYPNQQIKFLGFELNYVSMTITLANA